MEVYNFLTLRWRISTISLPASVFSRHRREVADTPHRQSPI
jgi:hypothetical protein